ncbi:MAG: HAD family phosphatase [Phycisphaerales bacterium]|nr:HAD family phosphatase [Phycisphaerales bacterium]MCB9856409.1 HAD family phosphatase [Phycisphaerales bacterium]MCB9864540.1 HAD family phosphatase [Phycisphaerales bacterium]
MIQAVIFDMDGVLVDSYAPHLESWRVLAKEIGAEISDEQFDHTFGRTSRDIIRMLFDVTDDDRVRAYDERKESLYRDIVRDNVPEMPGATALLERLATKGITLAVGTSGPRENINLVCDGLGWNELLRVRVTGADVTHGKPDPEIFLQGASRLGVAPDKCVVVEDAPAGIEAAKRGGMRCIGLTSTHEANALSEATRVVDAIADVWPVIESWR